MGSIIRRLPDAELEVMQAVWSHTPPVSRAAIEQSLQRKQPMALTTLLTLLTRLAEKGFLSVRKIGRSNRYTPQISQQEYLASQSSHFFHQLCGGSMSTFAAALCDSGLTREELAQLRDLLERDAL